MFKPNIRGVGKANLRLEVAGWRNRQDNSLIKHRFPWRLNWIERVAGDTSLIAAMARSGQVFLVLKQDAAVTKSVHVSVQSRPKKLLLFGVISAVGVLVGILVVPTSAVSKAVVQPSHTTAVNDCRRVLLDPEIEITKWLGGTAADEVVVQELQREELGGIQLRRIRLSCHDHQELLQISLTLRGKTWQLKKFARLDN